jgi:hypothetical protein
MLEFCVGVEDYGNGTSWTAIHVGMPVHSDFFSIVVTRTIPAADVPVGLQRPLSEPERGLLVPGFRWRRASRGNSIRRSARQTARSYVCRSRVLGYSTGYMRLPGPVTSALSRSLPLCFKKVTEASS